MDAEGYAQRACSLSRELGDRVGEAAALNRLGALRYLRADFEGACELFRESIEVARRSGHVYGQCIASLNLAGNLRVLGRGQQALTIARVAVDLAVLGGTRDLEAAALVELGHSLTVSGRWTEAIEAHTRSRDLFLLNGCPQYTSDPLSGLAEAHLAAGDLAGALGHVDALLRYLGEVGNLHGADDPPGVLWRCYQVLARAADPRASAVLVRAHDEVMKAAASFDDPADRDRYVAAEPAQRGIVTTWQATVGDGAPGRAGHPSARS